MVLGVGVLLLCAVFVAISVVTHPFDSPFHHQYGQLLHVLVWNGTGRYVSDEWEDYTGVVRFWDDRGGLLFRQEYLAGERHGVWVDYHSDGSVDRVHEYRDGMPWNGVCNIAHLKAWRAEYRDGEPWNGVTWHYKPGPSGSVDRFWVDRREVSEDEYEGSSGFSHQQLTRPYGVVMPTD